MVEELVKLRVSVARLGQLLGLSGEELDIKDKSYGELCVIAAAHSRGWNQLAMRVAEQIEALREALRAIQDVAMNATADEHWARVDSLCNQALAEQENGLRINIPLSNLMS